MIDFLVADSVKFRRTWILPLAVLGPLGVGLLGFVDFYLREEWLAASVAENGPWNVMLSQLGMVECVAIVLGAALLASLIFDVDHRADAWKAMFALPVKRSSSYVAKLAAVSALLLAASGLTVACIVGIWAWQGFGPLPWDRLAILFVAPWVGVLPVAAIQAALSAHVRNQAVAIIIGVAGTQATLFGMFLPDWLPWSVPFAAMEYARIGAGDPARIGMLAFAWCTGATMVGAWAFARREVV